MTLTTFGACSLYSSTTIEPLEPSAEVNSSEKFGYHSCVKCYIDGHDKNDMGMLLIMVN